MGMGAGMGRLKILTIIIIIIINGLFILSSGTENLHVWDVKVLGSLYKLQVRGVVP